MNNDAQNNSTSKEINPLAIELIETILERGTDQNFTDSEGNTPISVAAEKGFTEVVDFLLRYGAEIPHEMQYKIAKEIQETQTFDEQMVPYSEIIEKLKKVVSGQF